MTKVTKMLMHPDILEFMQAMNFYISEGEDILRHNEPTLIFQYEVPYQKLVVVQQTSKGLRIECRTWNDEPGAERYSTSLVAVCNPNLDSWLLLMHIGDIIPLGKVCRKVAENAAGAVDLGNAMQRAFANHKQAATCPASIAASA